MCSTPRRRNTHTLMPVSLMEETTEMEGLSQDGETEEVQEEKEKEEEEEQECGNKK